MRGSAALVALIAALVITSRGLAQDAPASPLAAATPAITTEPSSCTVTPRPLTFLESLVTAPAPETTPVPVEGIPDGVAPDEATRAEVEATVTMLIACVNGGDLLRAFALYEDGYLGRIYDPDDVMSAEIANELVVSFATPRPVAAEDQTSLVGLPIVRLMADGRVAVVTETNGGVDDDDDETELALLILAHTADGRWLIVDGRPNLERDELPAT